MKKMKSQAPAANPQLENGYLKIANELWEALCKVVLNSSEQRALWGIIRYTYGWNAKQAPVSIGQLSTLCGTSKRTIQRGLKSLEGRNIIIRERTSAGRPSILGINKHYTDWQGRDQPAPRVGSTQALPPRDEPAPASRDQPAPRVGSTQPLQVGTNQPPSKDNKDIRKKQLKTEDELLSWVIDLYEQNIHLLGSGQMIREELVNYSIGPDAVPSDWWPLAIKECVRANIHNWRYLRKILENWRKQGYPDVVGRARDSPSPIPLVKQAVDCWHKQRDNPELCRPLSKIDDPDGPCFYCPDKNMDTRKWMKEALGEEYG